MKKRYDDHAILYQNSKGHLIPGVYYINGYCFTVDYYGRTVHVFGYAKKNSAKRSPLYLSLHAIGQGDELIGDDRGHIIADMFCGPNSRINLLPQSHILNRGNYKKLEMQIRKLLLDDCLSVWLEVEIKYFHQSHRPAAYIYRVYVNNKLYITKEFFN